MHSDDDLTGIFDDVTPDDFSRTTSAISERQRVASGEAAFEKFVTEQISTIRFAFASCDGAMNPMATLASPTVERSFSPDDDETLGNYIDRLAREAGMIRAQWVFFAKKTKVGAFARQDDGDSPDSSSPEAMDRALEDGVVTEAVYWYAERRDADGIQRRHGFLEIEGYRLGDSVEANSEQENGPLKRILAYAPNGTKG